MFIGIDLGTSSVKLILVDKNGKIFNSISKEYPLILPLKYYSEQDPNEWYKNTYEGLKELIVGYENQIQAISFSGQMHGLVLLDEFDNILYNAILWNDQRTYQEVDYLNEEIGKEKLLKLTGNVALTGLTAPKILWIKKNEPKIFNKINKIMLPKDYLIYKLSNEFKTDVTDASGTLYFDVIKRKYSQEMLNILGIKEEMLPKVFESYEVIGNLKEELKAILKIEQDVKIIAGGGDQAVGAIGVATINHHDCNLSLGTSGVLFASLDEPIIDEKTYLQSYAHANGKYHIMGVMLNASGALKWWNESILENGDYNSFFKDMTDNDNQIYFLPYLSGERSPLNNPFAKGAFFNLELRHTQKDLNFAVVMGITFALKDTFLLMKKMGIEIKKINLIGGGAKSSFWAQLIADVFNVDIYTITNEEGPALGAAILAMVGVNEYQDIDSACKQIIKIKQIYKPDQNKVILYQTKYKAYQKIYPKIKSLYKE